jgi:hypothetical protein
MRRFLCFAIFALLMTVPCNAPSAQMLQAIVGAQNAVTYTYVQSCGYQSSSGSTYTVACTFGQALGAGHLLYVCASTVTQSPFTSVTFSGETATFTPDITNVLASTTNNQYMSCWYVTSTNGGGSTITLTSTAYMGYPGITLDEWICAPGPCSFDKSDAGNVVISGLSETQVSNNITPSSNNELIIGSSAQCCAASQSYVVTSGSGFTLNATSSFPSASESQVQATKASIAAAFTSSQIPTYSSITHVAAFK